MARPGRLGAWIGVALLLGAALAVFLWEPWHGPVILTLSSSHGIDAGDLPALALLGLALALATGPGRGQGSGSGPAWTAGRWAGSACALVLGALLLAGTLDDESAAEPLLPAGGGTLDGATQHAVGRRADPVDSWTHLAVTYDGGMLRLFVNGAQVSSRATSGSILSTADPLWIGGNHPYGEFFHGVIDEVSVYDLALSASELRAEMSTPIRSAGRAPATGLVAAYGFDRDSGRLAADASGNGNAGRIIGATRTSRGRFGRALKFDGTGDLVKVPASASLDLSDSMTLAGWIRPSESQAGWRTILHRQTDAYFLMAGGGGAHTRLDALDGVRAALLIGIAGLLSVALASGRAGWFERRRGSWWAPAALLLAGFAIDAAFAPSVTLVGVALVAIWCALTAAHRSEALIMSLIAAVCTGLTIMSLAGWGGLEPGHDGGAIPRSAALGALLVTAGLLSALYGLRGGEQRTPDPAAATRPHSPSPGPGSWNRSAASRR